MDQNSVSPYAMASSHRRIHVVGNSCSGKSTLARQLSGRLAIPLVELDALNWQPGWVGLNDNDPEEFERRIRDATSGDAWVVAGSYESFARRAFWPRLQLVIWLDLPLPTLTARMLARSWRRWRNRELLWGSNYERFWPQLMVWRREDSLLWWIVTQHQAKRRRMRATREDPAWAHIQFLRLQICCGNRSVPGIGRNRLPVVLTPCGPQTVAVSACQITPTLSA